MDKLIALGIISVLDLDDVGADPLVAELKLDRSLAQKLVEAADREAKALTAEADQKRSQKQMAQQARALETTTLPEDLE